MAASILVYGCTTSTLTKHIEKKLNENYTRMQRTVLNKFWKQNLTRQQLYGHLRPISKTIQVRWTRYVGHYLCDILLWTSTHACVSFGQPATTYLHQLCMDTGCNLEDLLRVMDDMDEWRESGKSMLSAGLDDNDVDLVITCFSSKDMTKIKLIGFNGRSICLGLYQI